MNQIADTTVENDEFEVESFDVSDASETERQFQITAAYPTDER